MHIAITGNIGAGKTTLATLLANHYGWDVLYEAVDNNPFLADFYADMPRWAFHLQLYFLNSRFGQMRRVRAEAGQKTIMQDRTIYEDADIFARNLHQSGTLSDREYDTYRSVFENMLSLVRPPDLMIYLHADLPKLRQQIKSRGRDYEQGISDDYLNNLNQLYEDFAQNYRESALLVVDVNQLDYQKNAGDFTFITGQIDSLQLFR